MNEEDKKMVGTPDTRVIPEEVTRQEAVEKPDQRRSLNRYRKALRLILAGGMLSGLAAFGDIQKGQAQQEDILPTAVPTLAIENGTGFESFGGVGTFTVTAEAARIRSAATTGNGAANNIVEVANNGQQFVILREVTGEMVSGSDVWYEIQLTDGRTGYVWGAGGRAEIEPIPAEFLQRLNDIEISFISNVGGAIRLRNLSTATLIDPTRIYSALQSLINRGLPPEVADPSSLSIEMTIPEDTYRQLLVNQDPEVISSLLSQNIILQISANGPYVHEYPFPDGSRRQAIRSQDGTGFEVENNFIFVRPNGESAFFNGNILAEQIQEYEGLDTDLDFSPTSDVMIFEDRLSGTDRYALLLDRFVNDMQISDSANGNLIRLQGVTFDTIVTDPNGEPVAVATPDGSQFAITTDSQGRKVASVDNEVRTGVVGNVLRLQDGREIQVSGEDIVDRDGNPLQFGFLGQFPNVDPTLNNFINEWRAGGTGPEDADRLVSNAAYGIVTSVGLETITAHDGPRQSTIIRVAIPDGNRTVEVRIMDPPYIESLNEEGMVADGTINIIPYAQINSLINTSEGTLRTNTGTTITRGERVLIYYYVSGNDAFDTYSRLNSDGRLPLEALRDGTGTITLFGTAIVDAQS